MSKLLVVDDDLDMLTMVRSALEKDGHQVDTEADAAAVKPTRCQLYDLLLFDVMMPGEDGFSLCRRIRAEVDCPILFLTARVEDVALVQGFGLGADDYIKKPFSIAELRARVNAHLRREVRQPTYTLSRGGVRFAIVMSGCMLLCCLAWSFALVRLQSTGVAYRAVVPMQQVEQMLDEELKTFGHVP